MRVAALSDLHLGLRQFDKLTKSGLNQREADVAMSVTRVIDRVIALAPDVVTIAGDVFHSPRPSNHSMLHALEQFGRLTSSLPKTIVVAVAGNHDQGTTADTGCILPALERVGVRVVVGRSQWLQFPERSLAILGVPDVKGMDRPSLAPDPVAAHSILVMHGEVRGVTQGGAGQRPNLTDVTSDELTPDAWSYIALGHYHQFEPLAPNMAYSGAPEFTSSNPWQETSAKGFVLFDTTTRELSFVEVAPSRRFIDLPPIDATGLGVEHLDAAIAERVDAASIENAVVRLVIENITQDVERGLSAKAQRSYKARALNFVLATRRADPMTRFREVTTERKRQLNSPTGLRDLLGTRLGQCELPSDVDREPFVALGLKHFDDASEQHGESSITDDPAIVRQLETSIDHTFLKRTA